MQDTRYTTSWIARTYAWLKRSNQTHAPTSSRQWIATPRHLSQRSTKTIPSKFKSNHLVKSNLSFVCVPELKRSLKSTWRMESWEGMDFFWSISCMTGSKKTRRRTSILQRLPIIKSCRMSIERTRSGQIVKSLCPDSLQPMTYAWFNSISYSSSSTLICPWVTSPVYSKNSSPISSSISATHKSPSTKSDQLE